jgi:hypothetical protein
MCGLPLSLLAELQKNRCKRASAPARAAKRLGMPNLKVAEPAAPTLLEGLVTDYLASRRARGLAPSTGAGAWRTLPRPSGTS